MADESFAYHEAAHPYVHTHQGNFPRVFAYVIYVLGARSIESQIAVSTFSVGMASMLFAYRFLRQTMFGEESILNEDRRTRQTLGAQT